MGEKYSLHFGDRFHTQRTVCVCVCAAGDLFSPEEGIRAQHSCVALTQMHHVRESSERPRSLPPPEFLFFISLSAVGQN